MEEATVRMTSLIAIMLIPYKGGIGIHSLEIGSHTTAHYTLLANKMSAAPERDLISRSRDFRRDMVSTNIQQG
jgi:hypothetical protein